MVEKEDRDPQRGNSFSFFTYSLNSEFSIILSTITIGTVVGAIKTQSKKIPSVPLRSLAVGKGSY